MPVHGIVAAGRAAVAGTAVGTTAGTTAGTATSAAAAAATGRALHLGEVLLVRHVGDVELVSTAARTLRRGVAPRAAIAVALVATPAAAAPALAVAATAAVLLLVAAAAVRSGADALIRSAALASLVAHALGWLRLVKGLALLEAHVRVGCVPLVEHARQLVAHRRLHLLPVAADLDRLVLVERVAQMHDVVELQVEDRLPLDTEDAAPGLRAVDCRPDLARASGA